MARFSLLVIGDNPEKQMLPYCRKHDEDLDGKYDRSTNLAGWCEEFFVLRNGAKANSARKHEINLRAMRDEQNDEQNSVYAALVDNTWWEWNKSLNLWISENRKFPATKVFIPNWLCFAEQSKYSSLFSVYSCHC